MFDRNPNTAIGPFTVYDSSAVESIVVSHNGTHGKIVPSTGNVIQTATATATADGALSASELSFYLNEGGNTLTVKVKYSDNSTVKTGTVSLT